MLGICATQKKSKKILQTSLESFCSAKSRLVRRVSIRECVALLDDKASTEPEDKCIHEAHRTELSPTEISHNAGFIKKLASTFQKALFTIDGNRLFMHPRLKEYEVRLASVTLSLSAFSPPNQRNPRGQTFIKAELAFQRVNSAACEKDSVVL